MATTESVPAFSAFQSQLRTLCLNEFPCGVGSWRTSKDKSLPATHFAVTLRDYGAQQEQEETLEEYFTSKHSPYNVDTSWSDEAKELRDIAIKSPWLLDDKFIYKHFKTLRIIDKQVTQLDPDLLKFKNLTELTLSCNYLETIDSKNIPPSLEVLELCANRISDLSSLCQKPPPLLHLGLGLNRLSAVYEFITNNYWPHLLSLDLSHNDLCDLIDVVRKLQTLPKLRNLVLLGNPLAFIPGYRGFVIDSLKKLSILDDFRVTADERHHFRGLSKRKEFILDEARLTIVIHVVKGILMPEELQNPDEQPEFPIIDRKYYVEYDFIESALPKPPSPPPTGFKTDADSEAAKSVSPAASGPGHEGMSPTTSQQMDDFAGTPDWENSERGPSAPASDAQMTGDVAESGTFVTAVDEQQREDSVVPSIKSETPMPPPGLKLAPARTEGLPWSEEGIEFNYTFDVAVDDLPALKEYFKKGMNLSVREEKVLSFPAEEEGSHKKNDKDGKDKDKGKGKDAKEKDKGKDKGGKDSKDGKKKKKGEPDVEMHSLPPEITVLGTYKLDLDDFIEGEYFLEETFTCRGSEDKDEEDKDESSGQGKKDKKKKKERGETPKTKKKDGKADKDKGKGKDKKAAAGKEKADKKDGKVRKGAPPSLRKVKSWKERRSRRRSSP
ncbi:leucine-rich repeat-containing protein 43-like isoform X2 [Ptychodera flava]|uniref:leucine-rich repeat-containing protein 43-like isoform X2 n=1 Tax=Ptychodera flava TaxID=63121 RepID=UPI003969D9DA